jgi:hypothetical protein
LGQWNVPVCERELSLFDEQICIILAMGSQGILGQPSVKVDATKTR